MSAREIRCALTKSILLICEHETVRLSSSSSSSSSSIVAYPTLTPHYRDKMDPFKGLSVEISTQTGPLKLHNDPDDDPSNEPYTCQRYVEAVTGATFKVKVSLHKSFPLPCLAPDDAVHITIHYDGEKRGWYRDITSATIVTKWSKGEPAEHTFSHISTFCEETQQWKQGTTTFGALDMSKVHCSASRMSGSHYVHRGNCGYPNLLV